jgi:AraC-like DNA-binding protein
MLTAANLGQAIQIFNRYFDVAGPIARQTLKIDGNVALWISKDVMLKEPARRVAIEEMISGNFTLCQQLVEGQFKLQKLSLDFPEPADPRLYKEIFQCPVEFEQDFIGMSFDVSLLDLKLKNADPETVSICLQRCRQQLDQLGNTDDIKDRVRRIIYESSCDCRDVETVAKKLCMSSRTLRRHLAKADTTFRIMLNEVRQSLAVDYLCRTNLSIDEIAHLLGYSETSSFRHAFKHWVGESPTSYRNQH